MQRRAHQDARTPEKMKRNQSLVANGNLSLEEKKRKILRSLRRLEGLGVLRPPQTENQILQMIAKVTNHTHTHESGSDGMFVGGASADGVVGSLRFETVNNRQTGFFICLSACRKLNKVKIYANN